MAEGKTNAQKLKDRLGFDPTKRSGPTAEAVKGVIDKIVTERRELAAKKVEELMRQAITKLEEMEKLEKEFNKTKGQVDKDIGNLMNQLGWNKSEGEAPAEAVITEAAPADAAS